MRQTTLLVLCLIIAAAGACTAFGLGNGGCSSSPLLTVGRACNRRCGVWGLRSPSAPQARQSRSSILPIADPSTACAGCHWSIASGHVLCATTSGDEDDSDSSSGSRRGRPKLTDDEIDRRKEQLRDLLCVTKAEIEQLVCNNPKLLKYSDVVESHGPKVALLQERLGINQKAAGKLCLSANRLLTASPVTLEAKMDWLQARWNLDKADLGKVIKRSPVALALSIEDNIEPTLENIQTSLQMSNKELTKLVVKVPELLLNNFSTEKLAVRLSLLRDLLNIEENDIAKLRKAILRRPDILIWSEESMLESQQWIKDRLGLEDARIVQTFRNVPNLLLAKVKTLEEKANWLQKELRLHDKELNKLLSDRPDILEMSMERKVKPKIKYLCQTFQLNDDEVKDLLLRCYNIFNYSIDGNLEKKLNFYVKLIGERAAKKLVLKRIYLIANYSLEKRLEPRLEEVRKSGKRVKWDETMINRLAVRSDALWEKYGLGDAK